MSFKQERERGRHSVECIPETLHNILLNGQRVDVMLYGCDVSDPL